MIDLWKLIGQTDFGPSPRRVRTESERVRNPRFLYKQNCAPVKTLRCSSIKMCPAGTSSSHQHRKPNLKWISSLSESDRLEIQLKFGFGHWYSGKGNALSGCWAKKTKKKITIFIAIFYSSMPVWRHGDPVQRCWTRSGFQTDPPLIYLL